MDKNAFYRYDMIIADIELEEVGQYKYVGSGLTGNGDLAKPALKLREMHSSKCKRDF